jgi:hypothetical protein
MLAAAEAAPETRLAAMPARTTGTPLLDDTEYAKATEFWQAADALLISRFRPGVPDRIGNARVKVDSTWRC